MNCKICGAPATPGVTICEYCGEVLDFASEALPPAASQAPGGVPVGVPGGPAGGVASEPGRVTRALAPDGYWYPVAASPLEGGQQYLVRFDDGYQATMDAAEVRPPCEIYKLQAGVRVVGEFENLYKPGTVTQDMGNGFGVQFDDGSTAVMPTDRLAVYDYPLQQYPPGTKCLAQGDDGRWADGQVFTGPDQNGRQRVKLLQGGTALCAAFQINPPAGPDILQAGTRVLGIGPEYLMWYPGTVQQTTQGQALIRFDDGDEAWMETHQIRRII